MNMKMNKIKVVELDGLKLPIFQDNVATEESLLTLSMRLAAELMKPNKENSELPDLIRGWFMDALNNNGKIK